MCVLRYAKPEKESGGCPVMWNTLYTRMGDDDAGLVWGRVWKEGGFFWELAFTRLMGLKRKKGWGRLMK